MQLVDPSEFIPAAYKPLLAVFLGGAVAATVHENVTVIVEGNCSIAYSGKANEAQQLPSSSDRVAVLCLPSVANLSTYIIQDVPRGSEDAPTIPSSSSLITTELVAFGSLIASTGGTALVNANITVRRVALTAANLLIVASGSLWMKGSTTTMQFMDVTYLASSSLLSAYQSGIAAMDGGTIIMDNGADHGDNETISSVAPFLLVTGCDFRGYVSVIMPSVMNVSLMLKGPPATASKSVLELGCNLWDGEPLSLTAVAATSEDATTLRSFISYPRSYFNISILCLGANGNRNSSTATVSVPFDAPLTPPLTAHTIIAASTSTSVSVAIYASLIIPASAQSGGAISGLQRAFGVLRLASRCASINNSSDHAGGMFTDLMDNPLSLAIPVGASVLSYAAGAAVGNALIVFVIPQQQQCNCDVTVGCAIHPSPHCTQQHRRVHFNECICCNLRVFDSPSVSAERRGHFWSPACVRCTSVGIALRLHQPL
ncbi:GPI-anchored surface protein, putative [Bodo saltans]|uniref:GPI-anchored surface protein, putative n=1 Tax=Bodo saltans TaxID=75058 RepID=A0A0S4J127_BODSA|nr:GPI-anchored surface protein, putative [Bodo saltans]|eukprot:CUG49779.1 GPI-anchored surface protein, putative [Bodo saltans]